jgi:hypothetical protein
MSASISRRSSTPDGQQIGWIASMNDITEPRRARVELERAHERFVTVIDGLDKPRLPEHLRLRCRWPRFGAGHRRLAARPRTALTCCDPRTPRAPTNCPVNSLTARLQHTLSGHWYQVHERAIRWTDGRTVRVQIAADITDKQAHRRGQSAAAEAPGANLAPDHHGRDGFVIGP